MASGSLRVKTNREILSPTTPKTQIRLHAEEEKMIKDPRIPPGGCTRDPGVKIKGLSCRAVCQDRCQMELNHQLRRGEEWGATGAPLEVQTDQPQAGEFGGAQSGG